MGLLIAESPSAVSPRWVVLPSRSQLGFSGYMVDELFLCPSAGYNSYKLATVIYGIVPYLGRYSAGRERQAGKDRESYCGII
jgi:hypothetical protein